MNPAIQQTIERYLVSSATTFLAAFFGSLAITLSAGIPSSLSAAVVFGILSVAFRAAVKAVVEWALSQNADLKG